MKKHIYELFFFFLIISVASYSQSGTFITTTIPFRLKADQKEVKTEDIKKKEISVELPLPKGMDVYLKNTARNIQIKTLNQPKIKLVATLYYTEEDQLTDKDWFEKINLNTLTLGNTLKIKSGTEQSSATGFTTYNGIVNGQSYAYSNNNYTASGTGNGSISIFNGKGENIGSKSGLDRNVTIYLPENTSLEIENEASFIQIEEGIKNIEAKLNGGSMETGNLDMLKLRSKYANVTTGDIKQADVEITSGRFIANNIDGIDLDSKFSIIEAITAKKVKLVSTNDEVEIENIDELSGRKENGNLRINKLIRSIDLEGKNANVRIKNFGETVSLIKIKDMYAEIRLPLKNISNYTINFFGLYTNVYGNFEKQGLDFTPEDAKELMVNKMPANINSGTIRQANTNTGSIRPINTNVDTVKSDRITSEVIKNADKSTMYIPSITSNAYGKQFNNQVPKFYAIGGTGKGLKIDIKCNSCTVDFK